MKREAIQKLLDRFARAPAVSETVERALSRHDNLVVNGLGGGSSAALVALLADGGRPVVVLTSTNDRAEALADGIGFFHARPLLFPGFEGLPFEEAEPPLHIAAERGKVQAALANPGDTPPLIVVPVDALLHRVLPIADFAEISMRIVWGEPVDPDNLARRLVRMGFTREAMVESPGEFAIRGSIVDIYPPEAEAPWRLDFFGEELESIRTFDPATQRSIALDHEVEKIEILPRACIAPALEHLTGGGKLAAFTDLLPENTLIVLEGAVRIDQRAEFFASVAARHWADLHKTDRKEKAPFFIELERPPEDWIVSPKELKSALDRFQRMEWAELSIEAEESRKRGAGEITIFAQGFETVTPNFKTYLDLIQEKRFEGYRIAVVCDNTGQAMRLEELLTENSISSVVLDPLPKGQPGEMDGAQPAHAPGKADVALLTGDLQEGFIFPAAKVLILTDREVFGRYKRRRVYRKAYAGAPIAHPAEIQRGDFVVHMDHGIGQFEGIRRQSVDDRITEFIEIVYQEGDKLLVPIEKLNLVQKYASAEGKEPTLDRLGHKRWQKRRTKTQEAVRKLAGELLQLYAQREAAYRDPFGADTVWQQEFEASFLYQETPDQLKAIHESKNDMMGTRPMDRLICGDVGYGKTEVAIRAAFKALSDGRQVAVLAPTTILAQQHYNSFKERLADYPFKVGLLSRFRTQQQIKETLDQAASGEVNLVIGTHRLLSKDVRFANLGLLVVDEEQRFGVKQKERVKAMKTSVDVLTLTATPIPRTLHMALSKLRDLSLIQTPPADRLPIKTRTIHFEKESIEEAILRELNRGGQIFFVHNRIASIDEVAQSIREIVPGVRLSVAHGQMDEEALEQIMMDFIAQKSDILLSTTIIENGIDIPNVNTIIVNRADAFGLAQLYQLRGRVGRDVRQAYAYLILPQGKPITDTAMKRLAALEEFTELGMGFSIAMRDMEIRGTGNILGPEQSGAITDVGFDLYCRLLEEAVLELKGEAPTEGLFPTEVKWPVDQWLPEAFVPIEAQRIRFYKDLASARTGEEVTAVEDELRDCYGTIPGEGINLLNAFRVKLALAPWRVETIKGGIKGCVRMTCRDLGRALGGRLAKFAEKGSWIERVGFRADGTINLYFEPEEEPDDARILADLADLLKALPVPTERDRKPEVEPQMHADDRG